MRRRRSPAGRAAAPDGQFAKRFGRDRVGGDQQRATTPPNADGQHEKRPAPLRAAGQPAAREACAVARERLDAIRPDFDAVRLPAAPGHGAEPGRSGECKRCRRGTPAAEPRRERGPQRGGCDQQANDGKNDERRGRTQRDARGAGAPRRRKGVAAAARTCRRGRCPRQRNQAWRLKTSVPFVPPNPNEFFSATSIFISRAVFAQ